MRSTFAGRWPLQLGVKVRVRGGHDHHEPHLRHSSRQLETQVGTLVHGIGTPHPQDVGAFGDDRGDVRLEGPTPRVVTRQVDRVEYQVPAATEPLAQQCQLRRRLDDDFVRLRQGQVPDAGRDSVGRCSREGVTNTSSRSESCATQRMLFRRLRRHAAMTSAEMPLTPNGRNTSAGIRV